MISNTLKNHVIKGIYLVTSYDRTLMYLQKDSCSSWTQENFIPKYNGLTSWQVPLKEEINEGIL